MDGSTSGPPGTGSRLASVGRPDAEQIAMLLVVLVALTVVAVGAFGQAVVDWHYQLAGLADPFLGRPAPGWTAAWCAAGSLLYALLALGVRTAMQRGNPENSTGTGDQATGPVAWWRPRWWWLLVALWGGYAAGIVVTQAAGGPIDRPGTMRLELGAPLNTALEVPATCRTAPGKPGTVVLVSGDGGRLPVLQLANQATAEPARWPAPGAVNISGLTSSGSRAGVEVPGIPERPAMIPFDTAPGVHIQRPAMTILEPYVFQPTGSEVRAGSGTGRFEATRTYMPEWVLNQLLPGDPWPASYPLTVHWTCDLASTKAVGPAPVPAAQENRIQVRSSTALEPPATVRVDLRIVTGSERATVEIEGAAIIDADPPVVEGAASARRDGSVLRIEQAAASARSGTVVGATFKLRLGGLAAGSRLGLRITTSGPEPVEVTVYNGIGGQPVPVFVHDGISADQPGWPIAIDADWLIQPVEVFTPAPPPEPVPTG